MVGYLLIDQLGITMKILMILHQTKILILSFGVCAYLKIKLNIFLLFWSIQYM